MAVGACSEPVESPLGSPVALPPAAIGGGGEPVENTDQGEPAGQTDEGTGDAEKTPGAASPTEIEPGPSGGSPEADAHAAADAALDSAPDPSEGESEPGESEEPKKVLILGSSLAATGFGAILERRLDAHPTVRCYRKGKSSTGLSRPDFYDWVAEGTKQVEFREPDIVVIILGGNDGQDLTPKSKGKRVPWHSSAWDAGYRQRMNEFLAAIAGEDRKVLWLGLPRTRTVKFEAKMKLIRAAQQDAVEGHGEGYRYLDTTPLISGEDGVVFETVGEGKRKDRLHAKDGIHFTMTGATYLADLVYLEVLNDLGLEPVDD
jgi:hypothetical protein